MKYTYNKKTYNIPDEAVDKIMETYDDISISEACELWLDDNEKIKNAEAERMTAEAKKIVRTIHKARTDEKKERKPREKKVNASKRSIIEAVFRTLEAEKAITNLKVTNNEKYIDFSLDGKTYTLNLVEHREKKVKS